MEQRPTEGGDKQKPSGPETGPNRRQRFQFGPWLFNINKALAMVVEAPRGTIQLPVMPWARFYGLDSVDGTSVSLFSPLPEFDRDYAMTTDLANPLLVASLRNREGETFPLLVDGTHRLYRAFVERVDRLPAFVLSVDESLAVREDAHYR